MSLSRVHTLGCKKGDGDHPETRAILFEEKTYRYGRKTVGQDILCVSVRRRYVTS